MLLEGGALLTSPTGSFGADLDLLASVKPSSGELVVTVANLNAVGWFQYNVTLTLKGLPHMLAVEAARDAGATATVTTLQSQGYGPQDMFDTVETNVSVVAGGTLKLVVPPFSVVHVRVV